MEEAATENKYVMEEGAKENKSVMEMNVLRKKKYDGQRSS